MQVQRRGKVVACGVGGYVQREALRLGLEDEGEGAVDVGFGCAVGVVVVVVVVDCGRGALARGLVVRWHCGRERGMEGGAREGGRKRRF